MEAGHQLGLGDFAEAGAVQGFRSAGFAVPKRFNASASGLGRYKYELLSAQGMGMYSLD